MKFIRSGCSELPVFSLFSVALMLLISRSVFSEDSCSIRDLPESLRQFISDEQSFESHYLSQNQNIVKWDSPFASHQRSSFSLPGCWVSQNRFKQLGGKIYKSEGSLVTKQFFRSNEGSDEILFFIHPDPNSIEEYKKIGFDVASSDFSCANFCATPTSSNRTLVVWSPQEDSDFKPVMVKTSLNTVFTGSFVKNVSESEAVKSFTINKIINQQQIVDEEFSNRFRFFKEPLAFSLRPLNKSLKTNFDSGAGMIVREIPEQIMDGELHIITAFALYGDPITDGDVPYLLKAFQGKSRSELDELIKENLIKPFVADWLKAIIDWGLATESHGQNLLVELDKQGLPNGRFWYRDLDGFDLEFVSRKFRNLGVDDAIKGASRMEIQDSLSKKFNIFISQLQRSVDSWERNELISKSETHIPYKNVLRNELTSQLAVLAKVKYQLEFEIPTEALTDDEWYGRFVSAVIALQEMTALDSAAARGDWSSEHEGALQNQINLIVSLEAFGFSSAPAIKFFKELPKGNTYQEKIRALRINIMESHIKDPANPYI